jgi:cyclophilin family peptidyl-prolyl cis-trans isomerase
MIEYSRPVDSVSVRKLLSHPSPRVRRRAALAAGRIATPDLSRQVHALLGDEDAAVRAAAAWGLGLAQDGRAAEPLLLRVALDEDVAVRVAALRSLGLVGGAGAARALLKLAVTPGSDLIRQQLWFSLALLARRGSSLTRAAAPVVLTRLEKKGTPVPERRAAAYLLATLVERYAQVRKGFSVRQRKRLKVRFGAEVDAETRMQLGRAVIRLGLLSSPDLAALARKGGTAGRLALGRLLRRDGARGVVVGPLVDEWVKALPAAACSAVSPVMLWQGLGGLASGVRRPWVGRRAEAWLKGVRGAQKKATVGSCAAHQLARLACRAAVVADLTRGRVHHLDKCSGGGLSADEDQAFLAWGLARGVARRPFRRLRRLWVQGKVRARAAVLTAAGRLGGDRGHALVSRGLASADPTIFGAGATACGVLRKAIRTRSTKPVKHSCLVAARHQFLALKTPPVHGQLTRWLELTRLVGDIADNAVVARLKLAARHHHPTLRDLARASLASVLGRPPGTVTWSADRRPPPSEPLTAPVSVTLRTAAGPMTLRLRPDWAPMTAAYFLRLVKQGAYRRSSFHRVVPGFVVQGGDPTGTGFGGDTRFLLSEPSDARFVRGVVGLAHAGRDTESSQFFITLGPAPHLDGQYTAFAVVTAGLDRADRLMAGAPFEILPVTGAPSAKRPVARGAMRPAVKPAMRLPRKPVKESPMKSPRDSSP